jgi:hypothetical protein
MRDDVLLLRIGSQSSTEEQKNPRNSDDHDELSMDESDIKVKLMVDLYS